MDGFLLAHIVHYAAHRHAVRVIQARKRESAKPANPAREIRRRFNESQIEALLRIAWWDWPDEKVAAHVEELCRPNIARAIAGHLRAAP